MGLFDGGLFGKGGLLGKKNNNPYSNYYNELRRNYWEEQNSSRRWECRYCGRICRGDSRPSVKAGGTCRNSPYGTHLWTEC